MNIPTETPQSLVAEIRELLPAGEIVSFRTEYKDTTYNIRRRYLVLEPARGKPRYAAISSHPKHHAQGVARMMKYAGVSEEDAESLMAKAMALANHNYIGGWPLGERADVHEVVAGVDGLGDLDYGRFPALAYSIDMIDKHLAEGVARVEIELRYLGATDKKRGERRAWYTFFDHDGNQVAAHSANHTGRVIYNWLHMAGTPIGDDAERQVRSWGAQLKTGPDAMVAAFLEILKLDEHLGVSRIELRRT